jgi:hypothetical protein
LREDDPEVVVAYPRRRYHWRVAPYRALASEIDPTPVIVAVHDREWTPWVRGFNQRELRPLVAGAAVLLIRSVIRARVAILRRMPVD